jgi:hypothetical protein
MVDRKTPLKNTGTKAKMAVRITEVHRRDPAESLVLRQYYIRLGLISRIHQQWPFVRRDVGLVTHIWGWKGDAAS